MSKVDTIIAQVKGLEADFERDLSRQRKATSDVINALREIAAIQPSEGDNSGRLAVQIAKKTLDDLDL